MANVVLENISKKYGDTLVVDNQSLEIKDKEFLILVGPSGCGKSTTLRMIAGLEEISEGNIYIDGRIVNDVQPKDRDIAMVFQNYALYPHMKIYDNLAFALKLRKYSKAEIDERVKVAAKMLSIEEYLNRKPAQLSGGQRQRVALGRAIVREPKVFLMDEPLSNLDAKLRVQMRTEIKMLHERLKATMIYVTHDQTEAMTMGDRLAVMKDGIFQQVDTPLELYNRPVNKFVAGFIGSPHMNFVESLLVFDQGEWSLNIDEFKLVLDQDKVTEKMKSFSNKRVIMGIRPEDIHESRRVQNQSLGNRVMARVEVTEPMGSETFVSLRVNDKKVLAKLTSEFNAAHGEPCELSFDMSKCHIFDLETEENISLR
ncbi:MAG: sn-glycerol-3-phosphate ABC transporter ATP-binding protein UgpC [Acidaminobacter sp.]|uniref:ABC transporter ATP-binding protein n=1 Tax=Acidaminobacter sp. TaxID=1872102 RepID=UPI001383CA57|nr:ABC transporter ATP-binding protein [Acidaminobacter sp.]MZQ99252.1 sn-glycerol-3-phosphate ABC transporter ATP-binding protein UgpC [Acidaminobacter sp.]